MNVYEICDTCDMSLQEHSEGKPEHPFVPSGRFVLPPGEYTIKATDVIFKNGQFRIKPGAAPTPTVLPEHKPLKHIETKRYDLADYEATKDYLIGLDEDWHPDASGLKDVVQRIVGERDTAQSLIDDVHELLWTKENRISTNGDILVALRQLKKAATPR